MEWEALAAELEAIHVRYGELYGIDRTDDYVVLKLQEEVGELVQAYLARTSRQRDKGRSAEEIERAYRLEIADVLGILLILARRTGVDVQAALEAKWFVWNRRANQRESELTDAERALEREALAASAERVREQTEEPRSE